MVLSEILGFELRYRHALILGFFASMLAAYVVTPRALRKLRSAGITGIDINKADKPSIPEMGGLALFVAFNIGAFLVLGLGELPAVQEALILAGLVVAAGSCITGVIDDLVELRQSFKAFIPFAFAAPLALYASTASIDIPVVGSVNFGLAYVILLVPLGIACASNGFNMLEGFNGLGVGLGVLMAATLSAIAVFEGNITGLALLLPLLGALLGFLPYNRYPARVFPGDTMTLLVGGALASTAIISKIEFWGALLFLPHVVEFFLKARGGFKGESFASRIEAGRLHHDGPIYSLTHLAMRIRPMTEPGLVIVFWAGELVWCALVFGLYWSTGRAPLV